MILALIILAPLVILALWQFIKLSPEGVEKRKVRFYNSVVLLVGVLLCGLLTLNVYENMAGGSDRAWWPVLSVLGSLVVFPVCLMVGGIIRNYLVFRTPKTGA